jgi:cytochrome c2
MIHLFSFNFVAEKLMTTHRTKNFAILLLLLTLLIGACQSEAPAATATPTLALPTVTPTELPFKAVGTDISIALPEGDINRGQEQAMNRGCITCHGSGIGPDWLPSDELAGIGERAQTRFTQDNYAGAATSAEQYLFESIVLPSAYVVDGFADNIMISLSGRLMDAQEIADIVAYLLTLR